MKNDAKKVLITGSSGKVGEAFYNFICSETNLRCVLLNTSTNYIKKRKVDSLYVLDFRHKESLEYIINDEKPDYIVNTVAYTNVDKNETDRKNAWLLNATLVDILSKAAKNINAHFITISTDYIFNGKSGPYSEDDIADPISYYGKSKLAGENFAKLNNKKSTIIRTNVVYGYSSYGKMDFIKWLIENFEANKPMKLIKGQFCNPTYSEDIAIGIYKIIIKNKYGTYNFSGDTYMNRYEIASFIAEEFNYDKNLISEISEKDFKQLAKRPRLGGLINLKAKSDLGIKFSTLQEGITNLKHKLNSSEKNDKYF